MVEKEYQEQCYFSVSPPLLKPQDIGVVYAQAEGYLEDRFFYKGIYVYPVDENKREVEANSEKEEQFLREMCIRDSYDTAYVAMLLLNSAPVQAFLKSIAFLDAKRPYTKKILARLDFKKMIDTLTIANLQLTEEQLNLDSYVTEAMYRAFQELVH